MKNTLLLILAVMSLAITVQAKSMSAQLTLSYLGHADSGFREIYGSGGIQPGGQALTCSITAPMRSWAAATSAFTKPARKKTSRLSCPSASST